MNKIRLSLSLCLIVCLGGCQSPKDVLGFERQHNDEFSVLPRKNLKLPSDFAALPQPQLQAVVSKKDNQTRRAQKLTLGKIKSSKEDSAAEGELLKMAGSHSNEGDIRTTLEKENNKSSSFVKDLLGIKPHNAHTLDPVAETQRLKQKEG